MKLKIVVGIFAILLLGGTITPAISQTESLADHVVINEVEINPPGLDTASPIEWVELYNPTDSTIDISSWKISSSPSADRTYSIPQGTTIFPGEFLLFFYTAAWFTDVAEVVQLLDAQGNLVDETPFLTDVSNDNVSWQRKTDGFDSDANGDWINKFSTPGSSIGKEIRAIQQASDLEVSISADKDAYVFGETARIIGDVSKKVYVQKPSFITDTVNLKITGPGGFVRDLTLFPDYNLKIRTTLKLDSVLQIREGVYTVFMEYGGATDFTQFTVGYQVQEIEQRALRLLSVTTDEISYIPNQRVTITAHATELIQFESMKYKVQDRSGGIVIEGSIFPNPDEISRYMNTNRFSKGGTSEINPDTQFIVRGLIDPIAPVYGTYLVTVEYGSKKAQTTFELTADKKEDTLISLVTDKPTYEIGETVTISGRLNGFWIPSLDLEIAQSGILSLQGARGTDILNSRLFSQTDGVRLEGDSTFEYQYNIPATTNALGDWRVTVHKDIGTQVIFFKVVEDLDDYFDDTSEIFFVKTDKEVYDFGETVKIFGRINELRDNTHRLTGVVMLKITTEDGLLKLNPTHKPSGNKPLVSIYEKTAIPQPSGSFVSFEELSRAKYLAGTYTIKASYDLPSVSKGARTGDSTLGLYTDTTKFTVRDTLYEAGISVNLDKVIYGLGEEVHLTGTYPLTAQGVGIKITLEQPDGRQRNFGTLVDDGRFSWTWTTPRAEKSQGVVNERAALVSTTAMASNFGVYKLIVGTDTGSRTLFFTVSPNPDEAFISLEQITVSTDKSVYQATEKVHITGQAQRVEQGREGLVVPYRVQIKVETVDFPTSAFRLYALPSDKNIDGIAYPIKRLKSTEAFLDNGGKFKATIDLPPTIFLDGTYKVSAIYQGHRAQTTFDVENPFIKNVDAPLVRTPPMMLISTDKEEYERGETVYITTRPNTNIFLQTVKVAIPSEESRKINCGSFICGPGTKVTELRPDERTATFYHEEKIPVLGVAAGARTQAIGTDRNPITIPDKETFFVAIEAEFGTFTKPITVWNIPKPIEVPSLEERITEKFNRITESHVDIDIDEKIFDGEEFEPRVIQGSLFTPNRGQESKVNIRVTTESGVCLIGPDPDCTIRESTRAPGAIYQYVNADGNEYKVRYSGHEAKLEKFTILPADPDGTLPDMDWDIDVQKGDQSSLFYYKVTYVDYE